MRTTPSRRGEPSVLARLAAENEERVAPLTPPRGTRLFGWLLCVALAVMAVVAALRVPL